ncbi:MAG TPA: hypothetical protein PLU22_11185 [Polyangiaceae bacterium]|nr:hypothetical protein [Polyangiaceae bacterium]
MTDPIRLLDSSSLDEGARRVLDAGARLAPPPGAAEELWHAIAAALPPGLPPAGGGPAGGDLGPALPPGAAAPAGGGGAGLATGAGAALSAGALVKTALVGFSIGLGVLFVGGTSARFVAAPAGGAPAAATRLAASAVPAAIPGTAPSPREEAPLPAAAPGREAPSVTVALAEDALSAEARRVAEARAVLHAGDGAAALAVLRAAAREFPAGELAEERAVLEVEALVALGRRSEAEAAATTLLGRHPRSPHAARVREALR